MKKKATVFLLSLMALLLFAAAAETVATAGSQSDPVVALSYLQTTFQPAIIRQAEEMAEEAFSESFEELSKRLEAMDAEYALYASYYLKNAAMTNDTVISKNKGTKYSLKKGTIVTGIIGTGYVLESGHAMVYAPEGGSIVDMTEGIDMYHGLPLTAGHGYIVPAEGSYGIVITSDTANVCVTDTHRVIGFVLHRSLDSGTTLPPGTTNIAYTPKYTKYADALKAMGLFRGTNSGYELDRAATRVEAIVMLIRILGEENNALSFKGTHPFTDVPSWANCYV
ncbi:MAG: hypothetical protein GX633_03155, partial [Clostridiales bacterium]|nr:hypothetical protein [Clostridiales bacterium]